MRPAVTRSRFGSLADGREVEAVTLDNGRGVRATILTFGATLQSLLLPDGAGGSVDVVLGHATLAAYVDRREFLGATVGRYANRIAGGRFVVDGRTYQIPVNDGANALHGGPDGFDRMNWEVTGVEAGTAPAVTLRHVSRDGEGGLPGTLTATCTYRLDGQDRLAIEYRATTDAPTIVNLSNHSYWNLAGEGSPDGAMGHLLTIPAEHFLPTDAGAIPTGEFRGAEGTAFDFRTPRPIGERVRDASDQQIVFGRGYDHNWVVGRAVTPDLHLMARVTEPKSGRGFELLSDQPGLQFYSGNFLDATSRGKSGRLYRMGDAIVLEPQLFPDTPNRPEFGSARLAPGEEYRNLILYRFSIGTGVPDPVSDAGTG